VFPLSPRGKRKKRKVIEYWSPFEKERKRKEIRKVVRNLNGRERKEGTG